MKALIVEDEKLQAEGIKLLIQHLEIEGERFDPVHVATNGVVARQLLQSPYDLVILDLKLPEMDGTQLIEILELIDPRERPVVIVTTAYSIVYEQARMIVKIGTHDLLQKPFELDLLEASIRENMHKRRQLLRTHQRGNSRECRWSLALSESGAAFQEVRGALNYARFTTVPWTRWDTAVSAQFADIISSCLTEPGEVRRHWRFMAKALGNDLYRRLFAGEPSESFIAAGRSVLFPHEMRLVFTGDSGFLRLPLELLNDTRDFFALQHPLQRRVEGIFQPAPVTFKDVWLDLQSRGEKLRILLVASDTGSPPIPAVDAEVEAIKQKIESILPGNQVIVDLVRTRDASIDEIRRRLIGCRYHILHYAGHGTHNERHPDESSLYFRESATPSGNVVKLTVAELRRLLSREGHHLKFVYFSCCSGAATGDENTLLTDDFLGLADGLVHARIPAVLGFRWPLTDAGAKHMAEVFYESLFATRDYGLALFRARSSLAGSSQGHDSSDWLSPILIVQE
jgi:DNA-binding response OmpR family regulator